MSGCREEQHVAGEWCATDDPGELKQQGDPATAFTGAVPPATSRSENGDGRTSLFVPGILAVKFSACVGTRVAPQTILTVPPASRARSKDGQASMGTCSTGGPHGDANRQALSNVTPSPSTATTTAGWCAARAACRSSSFRCWLTRRMAMVPGVPLTPAGPSITVPGAGITESNSDTASNV
ncbi:MAG: hypothetical protein H0U59_02830 [Gemmatimonadaceae bacterium]|nr:hypothetical protein [Gemmatimonadaceae bacterium]